MGLRGWFKKQAKDTKKSFEQLGKDTKKGFDKAGGGIEGVFNKFKKEIEKAANRAKNEVESTANRVKNDVESTANRVKNDVEKTANKAKNEVEGAVKDIPKHIEKVAQKVIDEISDAILSEGIKKSLQAIRVTRKKMEELEKKKPQLVEFIDNVGYSLKLGPVTLKYTSFYSRALVIEKELEALSKKKLKLNRTTILDTVKALAPDTVDLGISVNLAALVVSSDDLGLGFDVPEIPIPLFLELGDLILKEIGIPK